jgi:hypothetical protein
MTVLDIIRAMIKTSVTDQTLAKKSGLPLKLIQRYRLAVNRFYNGAEKEPGVKWRKR